NRLSRVRSTRSSREARPSSSGTGTSRPDHSWTVTTSRRRPTSSASWGTYRQAAVATQRSTSQDVVRCTQRCAGPNRCTREAGSGGGGVIAAVGPSDPGVDVIAELLPVAGADRVGDGDPGEPFRRLVEVHRG